MLNIVLIDILYNIPWEATRNAIFFTAGLLYLLFLYFPIIKYVLFASILPKFQCNNITKYLVRVIVIGCSLAFNIYAAYFVFKAPKIAGKWKVVETTKNNQLVSATSWLTDSTNWKNIYIEKYMAITLSPNPYIIEEKRAQKGNYVISNDTIKLSIFQRKEPVFVHIKYADDKSMNWEYNDGKDTMRLVLMKAALY